MGNQQKLKQAAVDSLLHDIQLLDASGIEYVGHSLLQAIEGATLIHRGLNKDGKPVGYTLDSFSADRSVVGEYSTDASYFDAPFTKIRGDCQHAKKLAPQCKRLYLISNQACRNTDWEAVSDVVKSELGEGVSFQVYDQHRLAVEIYDQTICKNNLIEYFSDFLPSLWKVWTENAISHSLPETPVDYVDDPERLKAVEELFALNSIVSIYGISGLGKSYSAIAYARTHFSKFRNVIWVSGRELVGVTCLAAVTIARLGVSINLASKLSTSSCLLVIDDWKNDASQILKLLPKDIHPETRILLTSINKPGTGIASVSLPELSKACAIRILLLGIGADILDEQANEICQRVGWHPLTLAIIRDTIRENGVPWNMVIDDLPNIPKYEDPNHETILQRILLNHSSGIADELRILLWLDVTAIDAELAQSMLGISGVSKLLRRSLLHKDGRGMCRMHDLVHACLQHFTGGNIPESAIEDKLKSYLISSCETGSYHFQRSLQIHAEKIKSWVDISSPEPGITAYFFQLTESLSKPLHYSETLRVWPIKSVANQRESCLSIIEAIEQRYWNESNETDRCRILHEGITNIADGVANVSNDKLKTDLLHHRGKLFLWNKQPDLALLDFEEVLKRDKNAFQTHLQLARLKENSNAPECENHVEVIINAFAKERESVGITIVLAAFAEMGKTPYVELRDKYLVSDPSLLIDAVSLAVAEGFSQPYRALGKIARHIFYTQPEALIIMAEMVSFPPPTPAISKECFDIGEFMKSIGKASAEVCVDDKADILWYKQAMAYFDLAPSSNEFQITMKAECLIRLDRYEEAINALDQKVRSKSGPHWWHRRCQALNGLNKGTEALIAINNALDLNTDTRYVSAFLQAKSKVEASMGLSCSINTLEEAILNSIQEKFKKNLEIELIALRKQFHLQ